MAVRTRTGGSFAVQDEDFQPVFEWKQEEGANHLLLYLPDFKKEQLKITYVHSSHVIKVVGERPSTDNKWSKFNQSFDVPENCNVQKIQGKFQNGVLTIIMPKITFAKPSVPPTTTTDKQGNEKKETPQKSQGSMAEHKGVDESANQKQTNGKKMGVQSPSPKEATKDTKQKGENGDQGKSEGDEKKKAIEKKPLVQQDENGKKRKESLIVESEESSKKRKEGSADVTDTEKESNGGATSEKGLFAEKVKNAKKRMKEERQSLVNVGVAILVIAALGAYISYSYANSKD